MLAITAASAQVSALRFIVTDTAGAPLSGVVVAVIDTATSGALAVALTRDDGSAELSGPLTGPTTVLLVESLGYVTLTRPYDEVAAESTTLPTTLRLVPLATELATAEIRARRRAPPVVNNDTARVDIGLMRDSTERSVAELLAKAPGMRLLRDGTLEYEGRPVNRVKIDDNDLFGERGYAQPLATLDANVVDRVDAVRNNHEDPVLARLEQSAETILNITTNADGKNHPTGGATGAVGVTATGRPRHEARAHLLAIATPIAAYGEVLHARLNTLTSAGLHESASVDRLGRPEPIDAGFVEAPRAHPAWSGLPGPDVAPIALLGDARTTEARAALTYRGSGQSRTRVQVTAARGTDALRRATLAEARGAGVDYRLTTDRLERLFGRAVAAEVEHTDVAPSGKTSWRLLARGEAFESQSEAQLTLRDAERADDFAHRNDARDLPLHLGARLNRSLGERSAGQVYLVHNRGRLSEADSLTVDSAGLDFGALGLSRAVASLRQARELDYERWRGGARVFLRSAIGIGEIYARGEQRRTIAIQDLGPADGTELARGTSRPNYLIAETGAQLTSVVARGYRLTSRVTGITVADQTPRPNGAGPADEGASGLGYRFEVAPTRGHLTGLHVSASRSIGLPYLPHQPQLAYLTDPFSLRLDRVAPALTVVESVGAWFHRPLASRGLDVRASLRYRYRSRVVSGGYLLAGRTRAVDAAEQQRGSSVASSLHADFKSLRLRTTGSVRVEYSHSALRSNIDGIAADIVTQVFTADARCNLPRIGRWVSAVQLGYSDTRVGGALTLGRSIAHVGLDLRYTRGDWEGFARSSLAAVSAFEAWALGHGYTEAELWYTIPTQRGPGPEVGVQVLGITRTSQVRDLNYAQPFLESDTIDTLPTTFAIAAKFHLSSRGL